MKSQTERIYETLVNVRPFRLTANEIHILVNDGTVANKGLPKVPKVSVNRALNELAVKGKVKKLDKLVPPTRGDETSRRVRPWRATYK